MSNESVRRMYTQVLGLTGGVSGQEVMRMLSGRARQLVRVTGYRLGGRVIGTMDAGGEILATTIVLMAGDAVDPTGDEVVGFGSGNLDTFTPKSRVLDVWEHAYRITATVGTAGINTIQPGFQSEWVSTNLLLPGISAFFTQFSQDSVNGEIRCVIEYSWEDASPGEIAKVMLGYGLDPIDFN